MATTMALKVSYNGDVRKITSSPDKLEAAIIERYGLELAGARIELCYQSSVVDPDSLFAIASTLESDKALKVEMRLVEAPPYVPPCVPPAAGLRAHNGIWCDDCGAQPIVGARYWKQLDGDTYDLDQDCFDKLDKEHQSEFYLKSEPDEANVTRAAWANETMDHQTLRLLAQEAKLKANSTKQEAKKLASCAKEEAKLAKNAAAAAKKAEKAYIKAEARAKKQAHKAEVLAKKQAKQQAKKEAKQAHAAEVEVTHGKLVNWCDKDCPAAEGDLIMLPCGRLCFHADAHPGNLRVNGSFDIQMNGGRGPFAQWEAVPSEDKPSVFRILSHQHRSSECYLGVDPSDGMEASLLTLTGLSYEFSLVPADSTHGLWSFYPNGQHSAIELASPAPLPDARHVYDTLQQYVCHLAESTKLPISMGEAPDDQAQLVQMLNALHEELPHGLKRIAMKKLGLRQFELPAEEPEAGAIPEEWDLMLQDLEDMGFESKERNLKAVQNADGNLKQAVRELMLELQGR